MLATLYGSAGQNIDNRIVCSTLQACNLSKLILGRSLCIASPEMLFFNKNLMIVLILGLCNECGNKGILRRESVLQ
jgi:hypothetical protein